MNGEPRLLDLPVDDGSLSEPWLVLVEHGWPSEDVAAALFASTFDAGRRPPRFEGAGRAEGAPLH